MRLSTSGRDETSSSLKRHGHNSDVVRDIQREWRNVNRATSGLAAEGDRMLRTGHDE